jgi:hypothetical protein
MIKKLDIPTKIKFQDFVKKMAVVHFRDTGFLDLSEDKIDRVMKRYTKYPNIHVEDFDVKIAIEAIGDQDSLPDEIKSQIKVSSGIMYHIHVEIIEERKVVDFFELMEFVATGVDKNDFQSLYALYSNSDTREESDFES